MSWWPSIWVNQSIPHFDTQVIFSLICPRHSHTNSPLYPHVRLFSNVWFFKSAIETQKEHMLWVIYPTQNSYCSFPPKEKLSPTFLVSSCFHHVSSPMFHGFHIPHPQLSRLPRHLKLDQRLFPPSGALLQGSWGPTKGWDVGRWDWKMMKLPVKYQKNEYVRQKKCYCIDIE